ncbi:Protein NRT1/ PTR FAMILY 8.1 [Linum perenne]
MLSMGIFNTLSPTTWEVTYRMVIVPLWRKCKRGEDHNKPPLSTLQRMGIGLYISAIAPLVAGIIELKVNRHHEEYTIFCLVPQTLLISLAEGFNSMAQIEFYLSELLENLSSMTGALFFMGFAVCLRELQQ